jgi:hypothetical protein
MVAMRMSAIPKVLPALACSMTLGVGVSMAADCQSVAAALVKDESELPKLEVAPPNDRPILCITLETVMAFAGRLKSHVSQCPQSSYVTVASDWEKMRTDYAKRFAQNRCRRTIFD